MLNRFSIAQQQGKADKIVFRKTTYILFISRAKTGVIQCNYSDVPWNGLFQGVVQKETR